MLLREAVVVKGAVLPLDAVDLLVVMLSILLSLLAVLSASSVAGGSALLLVPCIIVGMLLLFGLETNSKAEADII